MFDELPIVREAFSHTVRVVSTARLRDSVLRPLIDDDQELDELAELEGATNSRLIAENNGLSGISTNEFVYDAPHAAFINASFAYAKPRELNRFNSSDRGAWYAALDVRTCLEEVIFHMEEFLGAAGDYNAVVEYTEMFASFAGEFIDLRAVSPTPRYLDPNKEIGYPAGNSLAADARSRGLNGIIYPSVRHNGATCLVALWPRVVQSVAQGDIYHVTWTGALGPEVEKITAA